MTTKNSSEAQTSNNYLHIADGSRVVIVQDEDHTTAKEETDNSQYHGYLLKKYGWKFLALTLIIFVLTFVFIISSQPIYRSTVRLFIDLDKSKVIEIKQVSGTSSVRDEYLYTQLEIMKSWVLVEKVVDKLNLVSHPEFAPKQESDQKSSSDSHWSKWLPTTWQEWFVSKPEPLPTFQERRKSIVDAIIGNLSVTPILQTQLVEISFESPDPQLAAIIPNTLVDIYIESDRQAKLLLTKKGNTWLIERLKKLRDNIKQHEQNLQDYMQRQNIVNVTGIKSVAVKQIEELASSLIKARIRLIEAETVYKQVQNFQGQLNRRVQSIPAILNHPLIQGLKAVELAAGQKLSERSGRYGQKHPNIIAAKAELKTARENTATQIKLVIGGIINEYKMAAANVRIIKQAIREKKAEIKELNRKESGLIILKREIDINRQLYELFLTRYKESEASQDIQSTAGRVIEPGLVPTKPSKPNKNLAILIGIILGLIISSFVVFIFEFFNKTIKTREDVEHKLGLPLLDTIPKIKISRKNKPQWMFLKAPTSQFAESIRTIRTGIMLSGIDNPRKILMVTSSTLGEGKTTVSINEAFALGQMGKTLLIEADMRRPSMANTFGWSTNPPAPGLSELVAGTLPMKECIHQMAEELNVDIISSGSVPPNPLELLSSKRFKDIFEQLCKDYEYIIIDSPPTVLVSDAMVLAKYANEVLYVVKANMTPSKVVLNGLKRLRKINITIDNIVLNQADTSNKYYGYYAK